RFDVRVGMRQNDFEFEKDTKAVSRRHAVIQNTGNGYVVLDLNSKAGTYINKTRILPNQPHPLNVSDTVAFGNAGAEYVFEV
ncbi:FHA domain-containing protein, partial [Ruminococcaceae bacterium OttesenSCG-928-L11]|nr:FHA domain-containing protein [Ruminococcaceae bacterium OttesenSCG-928-L11]